MPEGLFYTRFGLYPPPTDESCDADLVVWDDSSDDMSPELACVSSFEGSSRRLSVPFLDQNDSKKADNIHTTLAIFKAFLASGCLMLPRGIAEGGVLTSLLLMVVMGAACLYSMMILIDCVESERTQVTYGEVGFKALGPWGKKTVNLCLFLSQWCFCTVYAIFFAENIQRQIELLGPHGASWKLLISIQALALIPLTWIRRIRNFAPVVLVADTLILAGIVSVTVWSVGSIASDPARVSEVEWVYNSRWMSTFGIIAYLFEGVGVLLPIRSGMKTHLQPTMPRLLSRVVGCIFAVLCVFGTVAYLAFPYPETIILLSLPAGPLSSFLQVALSLSCMFTFPLQFYPAARLAENKLVKHMIPGKRRKWIKNGIRALMVCTVLIQAIVVRPYLDIFSATIGVVACLPLALIFPPLFHMRLHPAKTTLRSVPALRGLPEWALNLSTRKVNGLMVMGGLSSVVICAYSTAILITNKLF